MEKIILTAEEIKILKDLRSESDSITVQLGALEIQFEELKDVKNQVLNKLKNLKQIQQKTGIDLNQKYGQGSIDLESGEFTKIN